MVAAVKSRATVTTGRLGGVMVDVDSGSSVSVQHNVRLQAQDVVRVKARKPLQLL